MSIQIDIELKRDWLLARFMGTGDVEQLTGHYPKIANECVAAKAKRLLVDFTQVQLPVSTLDRFDMGQRAVIFAELGIKIAAVATKDQIDPERFGELVAKNRGVNIRAFIDMRAAEEWLMAI